MISAKLYQGLQSEKIVAAAALFLPERAVPLLRDLSLPLEQQLGRGVVRRAGGQVRRQPGVVLLQQRVRGDAGCREEIFRETHYNIVSILQSGNRVA